MELIDYQDKNYLHFNQKIQNTNYPLIGIPLPTLKKIAKKLDLSYLEQTHHYFEEIQLEGIIIANSKLSFEELKPYLDKHLQKIDNWGLCDGLVSDLKKHVHKNKDVFFGYCCQQKDSSEYHIRFMIVMFLRYYLNTSYLSSIIEIIKDIEIHTYYIDMAIAWLICELVIVDCHKGKMLFAYFDQDIQKLSRRKILDSYRIPSMIKDQYR